MISSVSDQEAFESEYDSNIEWFVLFLDLQRFETLGYGLEQLYGCMRPNKCIAGAYPIFGCYPYTIEERSPRQ